MQRTQEIPATTAFHFDLFLDSHKFSFYRFFNFFPARYHKCVDFNAVFAHGLGPIVLTSANKSYFLKNAYKKEVYSKTFKILHQMLLN